MSFTRAFTSGSPPIGSDTSGSGANTIATSAGFNLATGKTVAVRVKWESVNFADSLADTAGNTYVQATKYRDATNEFSVRWYYCLNTTQANAANIWTATVSNTSGATYRDIVAFIYTPGGVVSFVDEDGAAPVTADTHAVCAAITAGTLAVCGGAEFVGQAATPDSGWTEQSDVAANGSHSFDRIDAPGGTITPGFTFASGASWAIGGVSFSDAGVGPVVTSSSSATPQIGDSITIGGTDFGASQGAGSVTIGGVAQTVTSWADTSIDITVVRGTNKFGAAVNIVVTDNALTPSAPFGLTSLLPITGWSYVNVTTPSGNSSNRLTATPDIASGDQISYETISAGVVVNADGTFSAVNTVQRFQFEVWTPVDGWGSIATQEIAPPALQRLRRSYRVRTHSKLWRREGWFNTRAHRAGWFNKDLILPAAAGDIAGTSDIVITPTGTLLGAGALAGTAALQFGAGSSALAGAGALLGTAGIAITPTGAITGAGALAGSSAVTLTPTAVLLGAGALAGTSALIFTPAATMAGAGVLAGSAAIAFTPTATAAGAGVLAGTSALVFTPAATLAGVGTLAGSIAIAFTPTGSVAGEGALVGSSALVFGGSLTADDSIAGVASLVFTPTATPQGAGELAGTSALVFDASGAVLGAGDLVGAAALVFGGAASLDGVGDLAGSAAIQFTPEGTLDGAGVGEMAGTASMVFDGAGLFTGVGALAGTAASTLLASGNLTFTGGTDLAAEVWNYVLNNGKTAEQNMVDILADVESLLHRSCTDENVQAGYNVGDAFRILLAVAAGKSRIDSLGGGAAHVEFDAIDDSGVVVAADMQGSERVDVTLTPEETS